MKLAAFNAASAANATISGGLSNIASGTRSLVVGGHSNTASGACSTIGGGASNISSAAQTTVAGGWQNTANVDSSAVLGGGRNEDYGYLGFSHWASEDIAALNVFENLIKFKPNTQDEIENAFTFAINENKPTYINLKNIFFNNI